MENQARMDARWDANFAKAEQRAAAAGWRMEGAGRSLDRVVAQDNRIVSQLVRHGVSSRSDVRRIDKSLAQIAERLSETDDKLNGLFDFVRRHLQGNGRRK